MFSNRSWSKAILSLVLTGAVVVLSACGSPSTPAADGAANAKAPKNAAPAKAPDAKAPAKPAEKAKPAPADNGGKQVVANFNFTNWDKGMPQRWIAEPADKVAKAPGAGKDGIYVELKPSGSDKSATLRQHLSGNLAGKSLTVTLRAKADEPKMLSAKLNYETKAGPQTLVLDAEGHGAWESITKSVTIPADAKENSAMLTVVLRPAAKKSVLLDYVTVKAK